jgi:peptide/nickel transport system permease protein
MLIVLLIAGFAGTGTDPLKTDADHALEPPSGDFWFGTDQLGRDIFARTVAGARLDLPLALAGTLLSMVVGVALGLLASTKGKWSERLMRGVDMFQAFPLLILAIVIVALTGNKLHNVVLAVAIINVPRFIRLVRADALALRESRFIEACIAIGASRTRILLRHVLPNVSGTILVQASLTAAQALVIIASLGFLGIGITPPAASWGTMIQSGAQNLATGEWWLALFPGLAVFVAVWSFNQVAEGVERGIFSRKR